MNGDIKSCDHGLCRITLLYSEKSSFALTGAEEATAPYIRLGNCSTEREKTHKNN